MRRKKGLLIWGIVIALVGGALWGLYSNNASICSSSLGQFAQSLSKTASETCTVQQGLHAFGIAAALLGVALAIVGGVRYSRGTTPEPPRPTWRRGPPGAPPPGWYQPAPGQPLRWWDGRQWGAWQQRTGPGP